MNLNEYQKEARLFAVNDDLLHFTFGLLEEAGEAAGVLKRVYRGDEGYEDYDWSGYGLSEEAEKKLAAELGDILWHIAVIADNLGLGLNDIAEYNLTKLQSRAMRNVIKGSGDER